MAKQGFYFDNMHRAYPFISSPEFPLYLKSAIVEFNCNTFPGAGFIDGVNRVWLGSVRRTATHFIFSFLSDAVGLLESALTFEVGLLDSELSYYFSDALSQTYSSTSASSESSLWSGFIIIGNLSDLADNLSTEGVLIGDVSNQVEPTLIYNLQSSFVRSISIANQTPTIATPSEDCGYVGEVPYAILEYMVGIVGSVKFVNGYSCNLTTSKKDNSLTFSTASDEQAYAGQFCGGELDSIRYNSELVPGIRVGTDQKVQVYGLYSGGPSCRDTLKSINGLGGKRLWIMAGRGLSVENRLDNNTILIAATLSGLAVCANPDIIISSASL